MFAWRPLRLDRRLRMFAWAPLSIPLFGEQFRILSRIQNLEFKIASLSRHPLHNNRRFYQSLET